MHNAMQDAWASGVPYEAFVGRWSRAVAREFLAWLDLPAGQTWGDVGCGTGALAAGVLAAAEPRAVFAIDRSRGFLTVAQAAIGDRRVRFAVADATALPWRSRLCAAVISGLMLNFVPDAIAALREMARVCQPGGRVAAYVWDYRGGMQMLRRFWDAAIEIAPAAAALDEGARFPLCRPEPLVAAFAQAGLTSVAVRAIVIPTRFRSFDDLWQPFLGKQGPAPTYLASLGPEAQERIRASLQSRLPRAPDGSIALTAQAWAVQGTVSYRQRP
ncbi:MAG: class I SAM-dependent methyltransferase [Chloroflexales bacterium]|nr:class I SAM-dependent methyltransferase [Chloroflexales bacterium]